MKTPTYKEASQGILNFLEKQSGWTVRKDLKVPWARRDDGLKFWFKSQSVYFGENRPLLSTFWDMREIWKQNLEGKNILPLFENYDGNIASEPFGRFDQLEI